MRLRHSLFTLAIVSFAHAVAAQDCNLANLDPIALDKNQNGTISRDEAQGTSLTWVFDKIDSNGDGQINQPEFAARCAPATAQTGKKQEKSEPSALQTAVTEKADRQVDRAGDKVESRVDKEADEAVDKAIGKGLDRLFGR